MRTELAIRDRATRRVVTVVVTTPEPVGRPGGAMFDEVLEDVVRGLDFWIRCPEIEVFDGNGYRMTRG